ncbi:MAG: carbonic anhydrase [Myxococcales bacterium]|nr:carbonic anhydrase [Myxococcales bacterium]
MERYQQVFENNRRWAREKVEQNRNFFRILAKEQTPDFLYIGCADSRVPASEIMGLEPGDVFVHRNIANIFDNIDPNANGVLQYAIEALGVKHIVVCGHYGCGGVKAAMQSNDLGGLNGWLRNIRDVYRHNRNELNAIHDEGKRFRRLVELNVYEQCTNVIKTAFVQKSFLSKGYPTVHGWVYDLEDGLIQDLQVDFHGVLQEIREIYHLD